MTDAPRPDERDDQPVVTPLRPQSVLTPLGAGLQTLDLGVDDATGLVCAIDDPDCVMPAPVSTTGDEDDA